MRVLRSVGRFQHWFLVLNDVSRIDINLHVQQPEMPNTYRVVPTAKDLFHAASHCVRCRKQWTRPFGTGIEMDGRLIVRGM